ncbi:hypothetical protein ACEWY4_024564 [Coilia grayii]|uniref:Reverse transcriptase RNase H-like domain-containing protein n=1 Tax=Coilia grayii TaxID=363190 RepID=A0ABD1J0N8_9TELE
MVPRSHSAPPDDWTSRLEATLSTFIQAQQARDERWERETEHQDLRWRSMQHQFQQLQMLVSTEQLNQHPADGAMSRLPEPELPDDHSPRQQQPCVCSSSPVSEPSRPVSVTPTAYYGWSPPKMTPYSDDEDIEHYLTTFERLALANQWPRGSWAVYLVPLLTGKARAAYVARDIHDTMDYAKVKDAILNKFEIDHDTYRHRFRSMTDGRRDRQGAAGKAVRPLIKEAGLVVNAGKCQRLLLQGEGEDRRLVQYISRKLFPRKTRIKEAGLVVNAGKCQRLLLQGEGEDRRLVQYISRKLFPRKTRIKEAGLVVNAGKCQRLLLQGEGEDRRLVQYISRKLFPRKTRIKEAGLVVNAGKCQRLLLQGEGEDRRLVQYISRKLFPRKTRIKEAGLVVNAGKCQRLLLQGEGEDRRLVQYISRKLFPRKTRIKEAGLVVNAGKCQRLLLQGEGEDRRLVQYISRKLFPRKTRYSTVEKECLAIKWALDSLRYYLLGKQFVLETDHRALQWLNCMRDSNARVTRWYLSLQPYSFTIRYKAGKDNITADFLSCLYEEVQACHL